MDQALFAVVMEAYPHSVSTRKVDDLAKALDADTGISKSEVSRLCAVRNRRLFARQSSEQRPGRGTKILRLVVVLAVSFAALLGTTSLVSAAPAPKLTPKQQQTLCIVKKTIELLKAIDLQAWKDPGARATAVIAIPVQAKAACPLGRTTPPPTTDPHQPVILHAVFTVERGQSVHKQLVCPDGYFGVADWNFTANHPGGNGETGVTNYLYDAGVEYPGQHPGFQFMPTVLPESEFDSITFDFQITCS